MLAAAYELRRADLHRSPGRQLDRHERRRAGAARAASCGSTSTRDVNETAAIVLEAKRSGGKSGVLILGGGSRRTSCSRPSRRFRKSSGIDEEATIISCRSPTPAPIPADSPGATPAEAVSWGKIDPDQLPGTVVVYTDSSIALPLLTAYARSVEHPGPSSGCTASATPMMERLVHEYRAALQFRDQRAEESLAHMHPGAGGAETVARR